jgi:hypothetical protein
MSTEDKHLYAKGAISAIYAGVEWVMKCRSCGHNAPSNHQLATLLGIRPSSRLKDLRSGQRDLYISSLVEAIQHWNAQEQPTIDRLTCIFPSDGSEPAWEVQIDGARINNT